MNKAACACYVLEVPRCSRLSHKSCNNCEGHRSFFSNLAEPEKISKLLTQIRTFWSLTRLCLALTPKCEPRLLRGNWCMKKREKEKKRVELCDYFFLLRFTADMQAIASRGAITPMAVPRADSGTANTGTTSS